MKTTKLLFCAISVAAALGASKAQSQTLPATLVEITPGLNVTGTLDNGSFIQDYPSGVMHFTEFDAFCVDPLQGLSYDESLVYQIQDISLLPNHDTIARLVGGYLASGQTAADAAAVNWAIWEVAVENLQGPSLLDGNVRIITSFDGIHPIAPDSQSTADLASQYLANIRRFTPADLIYLTNDGRQDVVSWNVIPEPGAVGLVALSAVCLFRRRR